MSKISATSNALGKLGGGLMIGFNAFGAYGDYKDAREKGSSRVGSAAYAAGNFALYEALGGWAIPFMLAPAIPSAAVSGYEALGKMTRQMNYNSKQVPFVSSQFNDYNQAFTMRQAGMQLAQASQYNLQQTLMGNEAAYLK